MHELITAATIQSEVTLSGNVSSKTFAIWRSGLSAMCRV